MSAITPEQFQMDYEILGRLGKGNCAYVQLVQKCRTRQRFALKKSIVSKFADVAHCMNEIEIIRTLKDQAIPEVYHYFTVDRVQAKKDSSYLFCIIMEYCQKSLQTELQEMRENRKLAYSKQQLWAFINSMARVLSKMQKQNLVHRDIKPANILIKIRNTRSKVFKLCDFGYATKKDEYSDSIITGTKEYASPRVYQKFKNNDIIIDGITAKDDIYSLGKTLIQMMTHRNYLNEEINQKLFTNIQKFIDVNLGRIIKYMLHPIQRQRWDFIRLQKQLKNIQLSKNPNIIDLQAPSNSYYQQRRVSTQTHQKREYSTSIRQNCQSQTIQVQTQSTDMHDLLNLQETNKRKLYEQLMGQNHDDTFYEQDQEQNQSKPSLKHQLRQRNFNFFNQVNCVDRVDDFLIFGMKNSLGVISKKDFSNIYILNFKFNQSFKSNFTVTNILVKNDTLVVVGTGDMLLFRGRDQFVEEVKQMTGCPDDLLAAGKLRQSKMKNIFFNEKGVKRPFRILEKDTSNFQMIVSPSKISCIGISQQQFCGKSTIILGHYNGNILLYDDSSTILRDDSPITSIKTYKNSLIYCTSQGKIKRVNFNGQNLQQDLSFQYKCSSPIICFQFMQQNRQINQSQQTDEQIVVTTPFIQIFTYDGQKILLNKYMDQISQTKISINQIHDLRQIGCLWTVKKQNETKQFIVEKRNLPRSSRNKMSEKKFCFINKNGQLFDAHNNKKIFDFQIKLASSFYLDDEFIVVTSFDGQIKILHTEEIQIKPAQNGADSEVHKASTVQKKPSPSKNKQPPQSPSSITSPSFKKPQHNSQPAYCQHSNDLVNRNIRTSQHQKQRSITKMNGMY